MVDLRLADRIHPARVTSRAACRGNQVRRHSGAVAVTGQYATNRNDLGGRMEPDIGGCLAGDAKRCREEDGDGYGT
jgi:hypothetical protein